jgi:LmbE family N-acetylglucosaminyl deacetylase
LPPSPRDFPMNRLSARNGSHLYYQLKRLGMAATLLHVGAHPDDEDSGLLTYVARKLGARALYWSATRGEGGQNIINGYRGAALGVYRTWESLNAREVDGAESLFGPFVDFGFSKNAADAFAKWGRHNIVRELVRAIRLVQPHIVVSCWSGEPADGHGHHQAVGQAILEAYDAAADPDRFPDLVGSGLYPWQPLKLYVSDTDMKRRIGSGKELARLGQAELRLERDNVLKINTGEFDPLDGRTFQDRAFLALGRHQTQGVAFTANPGGYYYYYHLVKSNLADSTKENDIFAGFDPTLTGLAALAPDTDDRMRLDLEAVMRKVNQALAVLRLEDPLPAAAPLLEGVARLRSLRKRLLEEEPDRGRAGAITGALKRKIKEFEAVIAACLGLRLECLGTRRKLTPGESAWLSARLCNHRNLAIDRARFQVKAPNAWQVVPLDDLEGPRQPGIEEALYEVFAGPEAKLSCPYWLEAPPGNYRYTWPDLNCAQHPLGPAAVQVECEVVMGTHRITLCQPAVERKVFPGGQGELPLAVVPPISLHPEADKKFLLTGPVDQELKLTVVARCNDDERPAEGKLQLHVPKGWQSQPSSLDIRLNEGGGALAVTFAVTVPAAAAEGCYPLHYTIRCNHRDYGVAFAPVRMRAPGLPALKGEAACVKEEFLLNPARIMVHAIDAICIQDRRWAYLEGAAEDLLPTLQAVGLGLHRLNDREIAYGSLHEFDTIIVGPNAYKVRDGVRENAFRLLEYVQRGGNLIVQYQGYEYEEPGLAPYPFKYQRPHDRVTQENSPVRILRPESALFRFPNAITPGDFENWIHDRGLYFWGHWDPRYTTYLACADPGEDPKEGGLVGCRFGQGNFLYVGYSLFRQLPAGVPGAFRLFFNLMALGCGEDRE